MTHNPDSIIQELKLVKHPEGGWFRRIYPLAEEEDRGYGCIYYLLGPGEFSAFHRIGSDELWHHLAGAGLKLHQIAEQDYSFLNLSGPEFGPSVARVKANTWMAAEPLDADRGWALLSCTTIPTFDFATWELGNYEHLSALLPHKKDLLKRLCI